MKNNFLNEKKADIIAFIDKDSSFISNFIFRIKKKFKIIKSIDSDNRIDINHQDCLLIIKEKNDSLRVTSSHLLKKIGNISKNNLLFFEVKQSDDSIQELKLKLFLGTDLKNINKVSIKGFFTKSADLKSNNQGKSFYFELDRSIYPLMKNPTYFINIKIDIPKELKDYNKDKNIFFVISKIQKESFIKLKTNYNYLTLDNNSNINNLEKPSVFLISLDGVSSKDYDFVIKTINGDKDIFNDSGLKFSNSISSSTVTPTSIASLLTGLGLSRHYLYDYKEWFTSKNLNSLSPTIKILPELLKDVGYSCYSINCFSKLSPMYGFNRGFDLYKNVCSGQIHNYRYYEELVEYLNLNKFPLFLFAHLPGAHPPMNSNFSLNEKNDIQAYFSTLKNSLNLLNTFVCNLKSKNIYDNSLIIVTSDHGRSLKDYTRQGHQFNESRIRVPLHIKFPLNQMDLINEWALKSNHYISNSLTIYDIITKTLDINKPPYFDKYSKRVYSEIKWLVETIDYNSFDKIGIVGYDEDYKYVIDFKCDINNHVIFDDYSINAYKLTEIKTAIKLDREFSNFEINNIIDSAKGYLNDGFDFQKKNPLIKQKYTTHFI